VVSLDRVLPKREGELSIAMTVSVEISTPLLVAVVSVVRMESLNLALAKAKSLLWPDELSPRAVCWRMALRALRLNGQQLL
jgi:hypothetical protein